MLGVFSKPERDYIVRYNPYDAHCAYFTRYPSADTQQAGWGERTVAEGMTAKEALSAVRLLEDEDGIVVDCQEFQSINVDYYLVVASVWYTPYRNSPKGFINKPIYVQHGWRKEVMRICAAIRMPNFRETVYAFVVTPYTNHKWKTQQTDSLLAECLTALFHYGVGWKRTAQDRVEASNRNLQRARNAEQRANDALRQIAETVRPKRRKTTA